MIRKVLILVVLVAICVGGWYYYRNNVKREPAPLTLYGNVDARQLNLSFLISERIESIVPEEGFAVRKGDLLGTLETVRIQDRINAAEAVIKSGRAAVDAASALYDKSKNGSRKEDIAMVRFGNAAIEAKLAAAETEYQRQKKLAESDAVSVREKQSAEAEYFFLKAGSQALQSYLAKLTAGERSEDIAAAKARLEQARADLSRAEAELAILHRQLADAKLFAPCDGVVRNRLLEPGELASPQKPVLTLAVVSPKWIRIYLPETCLVRVKTGEKCDVRFDGAEHPFAGWVGFISPTAEFTPKNIETPELRTSLVYEARVFVEDPENELKLGAPATVTFPEILVK